MRQLVGVSAGLVLCAGFAVAAATTVMTLLVVGAWLLATLGFALALGALGVTAVLALLPLLKDDVRGATPRHRRS